MPTLDSPLVDAVGMRTAKVFAKAFGMRTVRDLLDHYPRRLAERAEITDIAALEIGEDATVFAQVKTSVIKGYGKARRVEAVISDGRSSLQLVFFGTRSLYNQKRLVPGRRGVFTGTIRMFNHHRQLAHPQYEILAGEGVDDVAVEAFADALIPIYPATKDLRTWDIAKVVRHALTVLDPVPDPLDAELRARRGLVGLDSAIRAMHQPADYPQWYAARRRVTWDEALGVQLALAQRRHALAANPATPRPPRAGGLLDAFDERLPFTLTAGQREIGTQLTDELSQAHPMQRLLQGEVGSGKTVVALRAMLQAIDGGGQAALLAPTEVLAAQHARTIASMLGPLARQGQLDSAEAATSVVLLTGSLSLPARRAALLDAASGAAGIVVGTHALIQEHVSFADLGLVVVDEQHRFGVEQRDALRGKAKTPPHMLVMTATPIPRTVAMTVFGDLDVSTLTELPAGRAPITTTLVATAERPAWLERAWARIREEVAAGRQVYIVCPRIGVGESEDYADSDDADSDDAAEPPEDEEGTVPRRPPLAVTEVLPMLEAGPLAGLRIAPLHGRLSPEAKDRTMTEFAAGEIDVLVATTVIEVGVDVANATVMVILDADRFGVSQLHQLRGRVGRGGHPGLCLLVTDVRDRNSPARERLDAVTATTDGFELARLDVEQRREGDVLGAAQSGRRRQLRLLSLLRDEDVIVAARAEAADIVAADPQLTWHPALAAQVAALLRDDRAEYLEKA